MFQTGRFLQIRSKRGTAYNCGQCTIGRDRKIKELIMVAEFGTRWDIDLNEMW
jgi:hypothetical protein